MTTLIQQIAIPATLPTSWIVTGLVYTATARLIVTFFDLRWRHRAAGCDKTIIDAAYAKGVQSENDRWEAKFMLPPTPEAVKLNGKVG